MGDDRRAVGQGLLQGDLKLLAPHHKAVYLFPDKKPPDLGIAVAAAPVHLPQKKQHPYNDQRHQKV